MAAKCNSQHCNRRADVSNNENLCILCYDWFLICQEQAQPYLQQPQHLQNYQEIFDIQQSLSNGVPVDQNIMMRALLGSMMDLMSQNVQIIGFKEEISTLNNTVKDITSELSETKHKLYKLEYDVKQLEEEGEFLTKDSIVIRNVPVPSDGDEGKVVKETLALLNIEDFEPEDDIIKVERKGHKNGKLGTVFVKLSNDDFKVKVMKTKRELANYEDSKFKDMEILNLKNQEQIVLENALRNLLETYSKCR